MGTVSTALTDDQLSKCLKRTTFARAYVVPGTNSYDDDDVKCSICQVIWVVASKHVKTRTLNQFLDNLTIS